MTAERDDWDHLWRENDVLNALNPAQVFRRERILDRLALGAATAPVRLLDLGCGSGELACHALRARADAEVVGLDGSATGIALARRKAPAARFEHVDLTAPIALPGLARWATHAVCTEVLEHLDAPTELLRAVRPLLAPTCRLVVTVPGGPMSAFDRHLGHRAHFTPRRLRATLEEAGYGIVELCGAGFPFFNLYRLAVVARGERLVDDVASGKGAPVTRTRRAAALGFRTLFRCTTDRTQLGWQLLAVVTPRAAP